MFDLLLIAQDKLSVEIDSPVLESLPPLEFEFGLKLAYTLDILALIKELNNGLIGKAPISVEFDPDLTQNL